MGLSAVWSNNQRDDTAPSRPASASQLSSETRNVAPRVRPLRRWSWQKKVAETAEDVDDEWHHREGPLAFVDVETLTSVTEEGSVMHAEGEDEDVDGDSDAETVIYRPTSPTTPPLSPRGYTGEIPRYYALVNEMGGLPAPSSALVVLFPGDQAKQLRAQVAQVRLELAKKEEELHKTKEERDQALRKAEKAEAENRALRRRGVVTRTETTVEEKWWNW